MNRSLFDFNPPKWLPTQDKAVLEYCRNIKREEMEITNENGYSIRVVPHPSSAVTIELFNRIWDMESLGDIATVTVHIKKIREKIEFDTSKPQYIETIWGVGYRFKV